MPSKNLSEEDEDSCKDADFDLDDNLVHLGIHGFFPSGIYLILSFFVFLTPLQYMSSHVSSFTPLHHCKLPPPNPNTSSTAFSSSASTASLTAFSSSSSIAYISATGKRNVDDFIPKRTVQGVETFASCERFVDRKQSQGVNASDRRTIPCDQGWEFPNSSSTDSIVVSFDLVCSKAWLPGFMTSIFNVGQCFSGLLVQPLADKFGRKWMMVGTFLGIGATGVLTGLCVNNVILYVISKFFLGLFFGGALLCTFVMQIELYAAKYRMWAGMVVEPIWGLGSAAVALAAWLFPNWRHYHIATASPVFLVIVVVFVFPPDSLPWLMMNGKHTQAKRYLEKKLKKRGKTLILLSDSGPEKSFFVQNEVLPISTVEDISSWQMLISRRVLKQVAIFAFVSSVNSLVYYALSLMSTDLSGDKNISLFLSGIVEVPGYILAGISLHFFGRRGPTFLFHLLVGFFMVVVASIQLLGPVPLTQGLNIFSQICYFGAKLSISASYAIVFLYCPETFPTNVRNTCFGIVDAFARIGGVVAPYSSYLASISHSSLPVFLFSLLAFAAGFSALLLPEVHGEALPDTLEDLEWLVDGTRMWSMTGKRKDVERRRKPTLVNGAGGVGGGGGGGTTEYAV